MDEGNRKICINCGADIKSLHRARIFCEECQGDRKQASTTRAQDLAEIYELTRTLLITSHRLSEKLKSIKIQNKVMIKMDINNKKIWPIIRFMNRSNLYKTRRKQ